MQKLSNLVQRGLIGIAASLCILTQVSWAKKHINKAENLWIAEADLLNTQGQKSGKAKFTETQRGVVVEITVSGLEAGEYGIHFHEKGSCEPPAFTSAGGHFNPDGKEHGLENEKGPHAGDLKNLKITSTKENKIELSSKGVTLKEGKNSLLREGGTSIVIHAGKDDQHSDPAGNSGNRILCGSIERISPMDIKNAKTITAE